MRPCSTYVLDLTGIQLLSVALRCCKSMLLNNAADQIADQLLSSHCFTSITNQPHEQSIAGSAIRLSQLSILLAFLTGSSFIPDTTAAEPVSCTESHLSGHTADEVAREKEIPNKFSLLRSFQIPALNRDMSCRYRL